MKGKGSSGAWFWCGGFYFLTCDIPRLCGEEIVVILLV